MAKSIESFLIFDEYYISNMEFKRNYEFNLDENSEVDLEFDINANAQLSEGKDKAVLAITSKIFEKEFKEGKAPFYLDITINGHFRSEGDVDIEGFQLNGMAILLPYLRSIITSFTSQSGIAPVILPPINVYKAFDEKNRNE